MRFRLAMPRSVADGTRALLIAASVAVAGALVLAALHVLRGVGAPGWEDGDGLVNYGAFPGRRSDYVEYVTDPDLRIGVATAAFLLTVPVLALAAQALRVGSLARDRRMAALRLAGATPGDVRLIAAGEAGGAALAGVAFAFPTYLLLWFLVGVIPPSGARFLDGPEWLDVLVWVGLAPVGLVAGAASGALVQRRVITEPLGVRRRTRAAGPGRVSVLLLLVGLGLLAAGVYMISTTYQDYLIYELLSVAGMLIAAFAGAPWLVLASASLLARRRGAESLLAARRLRTDVRSAGRAAAVLIMCGLTLSLDALFAYSFVTEISFYDDDTFFYLGGMGLVAAATFVGVGVALITLLVGAGDSLVDARRPLATLAALGLDQRALTRVLARQLQATAVPAIALGALVGSPLLYALSAISEPGILDYVDDAIKAGAIAAVVATPVVLVAAALAARLLRPLTRAATAPENLRAP